MEVVVITGPVHMHSSSHIITINIPTYLFTGQMPYLSPNKQCQSTKGIHAITNPTNKNYSSINFKVYSNSPSLHLLHETKSVLKCRIKIKQITHLVEIFHLQARPCDLLGLNADVKADYCRR